MENNTKKCPKCMTEIDKKASVCPNCKADLRNWFVKHWIISIFLWLFVIWSISNNSLENYTTDWINNSWTNANITESNINWIWQKWYYVDSFWDKTEDSYITTKNNISWTFSNTATQDSRLKVNLMINSSDDINIQLYEYASNNPVKAVSYESYNLYIRDKDWNKIEMTASNSSDRLKVKNASKLHDILLKWWKIQFIINKTDFPSEYKFTIENADWYSNISK